MTERPKPQPEEPRTCPACNGTGRVRRTQPSIIPGMWLTLDVTCPGCGGTGRQESEE